MRHHLRSQIHPKYKNTAGGNLREVNELLPCASLAGSGPAAGRGRGGVGEGRGMGLTS